MIELNQSTFKRLIVLYFFAFALTIASAVYETIAWSDFADASYELTWKHFGKPEDAPFLTVICGGLALVGIAVHVVAIFGLLGFRAWSKILIWVSVLMMVPLSFVPGFGVSWTGALTMWLEAIVSMLFGAILLVAYSRDHGAIWFKKKMKEAQ